MYNLSAKDKEEWKAEVVALKAFYYFELVRRYGPVMIVPDQFDPNQEVESLKLPRSHVILVLITSFVCVTRLLICFLRVI